MSTINKKRLITIALCVITTIIIAVVDILVITAVDEKHFNNGICPQCGYSYSYKGYINNEHIYQCDNCGFATSTMVKQEKN